MARNVSTATGIILRIAPFWAILEIIVFFFLAIAIPLQIKLTEIMLDCVAAYFVGKTTFTWVMYVVGGLIFWLILQATLKHCKDSIYIALKRQVSHKLSAQIIDKLQRIKYKNFEDERFYDIINRIRKDPAEKISDLYQSLLTILSYFVELLCITVLLSMISPGFGLTYTGILLFVATMNFKSMHQMNSMFYEMSSAERRLAYLGEIISNKSTLYEIKMYNAVDHILSKICKENREVFSQRLKTTISAQKYCFWGNVGTALWIVSIFAFLFQAFSKGTASGGMMVALLSMVSRILASTDSFSYEVSELSKNAFAAKCLSEFFSLEEEDAGKAFSLKNVPIHTIEFQHVYFRYLEESSYVIEDISFTMRSNENIALVGCNGAGKSTLILLLCKLLQPTKGNILIDNVPLADIPRSKLSDLFAVVFQDYGKYFLTIRENVALGAIEKMNQDEKIFAALHMANAEEDFPDLSRSVGKLDQKGEDISGGQWQKLAIARAFFSNREFFIFDEPTAALDVQTENMLYQNLKNKLSDKGCIFISHRLPSAIMADRIIVIDKGRIAESGSHETLLKAQGIYARMYYAQADAYMDKDRAWNKEGNEKNKTITGFA